MIRHQPTDWLVCWALATQEEEAVRSVDQEDLQSLVDERALERLLVEYFDRIDANDPEGAARLFAENVEVEIMTGKRYAGRDRFARAVGRVLDAYAATSHHVSNLQTTITGDEAWSSAYVYAFHRMAESGEPWHLWARVEDRYLRTDDGWVVTEHIVRGVDSQPRRPDIPDAWYEGHRGRTARAPVPRRPR
jgi:uncharacterized protein (TIGR02246 family)